MGIQKTTKKDHKRLEGFLNGDILAYRHLDWNTPLNWIDDPTFFCLEEHGEIHACICAAQETPESAWLRFFASVRNEIYAESWNELLMQALDKLEVLGVRRLAALGLSHWFETLLIDSGFSTSESVVVLEYGGELPFISGHDRNITIRIMVERDLPTIFTIDRDCFPPIWQNSLATLSKAYHLSAYNTVALLNDTIVGYQISSATSNLAHLARLAVSPAHQNQHIGFSLVADMVNHFDSLAVWNFTVNTQSNNAASLNLYRKMGFSLTGEEIKVYQLDL